jgi:hypothetical protein
MVRDAAGDLRCRLRPLENVAQALRLAYGPTPDPVIERRCRGLARVSQLLATGADAMARIYAVLLSFPEIVPDGMVKLSILASLRKYNPNWEDEPRVPAPNPGGGQWTSDGDDGGEHVPDKEAPGAEADRDRHELCLERCFPLPERWKPYRSSDLNQYAFLKCM